MAAFDSSADDFSIVDLSHAMGYAADLEMAVHIVAGAASVSEEECRRNIGLGNSLQDMAIYW